MAVASFNGNIGLKARLKSGKPVPMGRQSHKPSISGAGPMPICRRSMSCCSGCGDQKAPVHLRVKAAHARARFARLKRNRVRSLIQNRWRPQALGSDELAEHERAEEADE
jgi:hypothetical protein